MTARVTTGATILVVEDETDIAAQIESMLTELGYVVCARASSVEEALRSATRQRPDLVLMDIRLRGLRDGIQTAEELRDRFGVPVVFFDPFFNSKPSGVVSGLGLSVCHDIVHSLGGEIAVDSQPGLGSTFRVVLPGASVQTAPPVREVLAGTTSNDRARVLVIDDEPLVRRAIVRSLEKEHDVVSIATAAEGLARLQAGEWFDLILCDLMMPEMTGMDMAARLKERLPKLCGRLVFLSGGAFTPESAEFLRSIGTRFVEKPFLPDELSRRVAELLITVRQEPTTDE